MNSYNYEVLQNDLNYLKSEFSFLEFGTVGYSVLGKQIPFIRIGYGKNKVCYSASIHANEWITSPLLIEFVKNFCYAFLNNQMLYGYNVNSIFNDSSIYVIPMVNPDGVDLVTGVIKPGSEVYISTKNIASRYPSIPFPSGWKANIDGIDLNLQFPAGWNQAKAIKYSQGFVSPAPRDFVGSGPLIAPESIALYNFTLKNNFNLVIAYHTQGKEIYWQFQDYTPLQSKAIAEIFANVSGYTVADTPYNSSFAGYKDWFIQNYRLPGFTIEAGFR